MERLQLAVDDDVVSICDRLGWIKGSRRVLLVLPDATGDGSQRAGAAPASALLEEWLDLVRVRRCAERLRLEVGLVTTSGRVADQARALGFPVFSSVRTAERGRRGWWRGRKGWHQPTRPGAPVRLGAEGLLKSLPDEADRREMYRRLTPRPGWQRWLLRYVGILAFFLVLAFLFVAIVYAIPGATLVLHPESVPLQVRRQIVADPQLETVNYSGASVPGRVLAVTVSGQAEVETTGTVDVPAAPARGAVVFANRLEQPATVPAGTRVSTSTGERIVFQTLAAVEVPGVAGGTAEAEVVALEPGPAGNVEANLINRIEGSLSLQLEVRNLEATTGGEVRAVQAVAEQDQERLRAQVLQYLQALAATEMQSLLTEREFLARDSLQVTEIYQETYSHFPGERADRLALEIRAGLQGTAVDASQANDLVYQALAESVLPQYTLVPDSLRFFQDEVIGVDNQGRVTFEMVGEGVMAARLSLEEPVAAVAGQDVDIALAYLYQELPLRRYPSARVWPDWFGRMPYLPVRIQTEVVTEG